MGRGRRCRLAGGGVAGMVGRVRTGARMALQDSLKCAVNERNAKAGNAVENREDREDARRTVGMTRPP